MIHRFSEVNPKLGATDAGRFKLKKSKVDDDDED